NGADGLLALKNQPRGRCPGAVRLVWEVCTVSQDLKIRAFPRRTATRPPMISGQTTGPPRCDVGRCRSALLIPEGDRLGEKARAAVRSRILQSITRIGRLDQARPRDEPGVSGRAGSR